MAEHLKYFVPVRRTLESFPKTREDVRKDSGYSRREVAKFEGRKEIADQEVSFVDMLKWSSFNDELSAETREVLDPKAALLERELQQLAGKVFATDADADAFVKDLRQRLDDLHVRIACLGEGGGCAKAARPSTGSPRSYLYFRSAGQWLNRLRQGSRKTMTLACLTSVKSRSDLVLR